MRSLRRSQWDGRSQAPSEKAAGLGSSAFAASFAVLAVTLNPFRTNAGRPGLLRSRWCHSPIQLEHRVHNIDLSTDSGRRIRVLFVDDQREVAKTLSGLLPRDTVECRFANNGEEGLARLLNEVFDLAVVDLRMPPGHWGGLWLLQELSDPFPRVSR